jgi:hypothetical protein
MQQLGENDADRKYLWSALVVSLLVFILRAPFQGSFWLDETITAWIVNGSLAGAWRRAIDFQGQSPFYFSLEWLMRNLFGSNEISLRFLSLLCGAVVVFLTDRISFSRDVMIPIESKRKMSSYTFAPCLKIGLLSSLS